MQYTVKNIQDTSKLAKMLSTKLRRGDIVTLSGDLGAGKTTFVKKLCEFLGVKSLVSSPSFTIINEYDGDMHIYHMDLYRIEDFDEAVNTGCVDIINARDGLCLIEWPNIIESILPKDIIKIEIKLNGELREFSVEGI